MKKPSIRTLSQVAVLVLVLVLTLRHLNLGVEQAAPVDAFCPFGGVESFLTYVNTGEFLKRINVSSFILTGIVLILTLSLGRVFCGFFCPLGALQEWIRKLGLRIGIRKQIELPRPIDRAARYLKYVVLLLVIYSSWKVGDLVFRDYDPYNALMHLGNEFEEKPVGYSLLALTLIASLFVSNWWCRYFCPLGAFLGIFRKLSPFGLRRKDGTCLHCKACDRACIAGLDIESEKEVRSADCVSCLRCVSDCPNGSLEAHVGKKVLSKRNFSVIAVAAFALLLAAAVISPFWKTKEASNILDSAGQVDIANLRGSNTLEYVIKTTGIPFSVFQQELGLPADMDEEIKLKDIGPEYGVKNAAGEPIEAEDFRAVIEKRIGK